MDNGFLRLLRVDMLLLDMRKQGLIDGYFVTDPTLFDVPDELTFDVVWLQRTLNQNLISHLAQVHYNNYLYDLDDFMIGTPSYIPQQELRNKEVVIEAIRNCKVLKVPLARLIKRLEESVRESLADKTIICACGYEFSKQKRLPAKPR